ESVEKMNQLIVRKILPGHYSLNLPPDFIQKVNSASVELELAGKLVQGNGCFDFDGFRIHV
ncbi:MAG: MBL fold metallo-hydrolase, partial [Eubacteriales bacterium]|nr:MBL fold metallo-hydrolase [Eubacteriales bacterium]